MINICSSSNCNDQFYRYKRPKIIIKHYNGKRTEIININKVCEALKTKTSYLSKYISYEYGTNVKYIKEKLTLSINGICDYNDLEDNISKFSQQYILCIRCDLPELNYCISNKILIFKCNACGYRYSPNKNKKLEKYIYNDILKDIPKEKEINNKKEFNDKIFGEIKEYIESEKKDSFQIIDYITCISEDNYWDDEIKICLIFEFLFDVNILKQIYKICPLLKTIIKTQKHQRILIGCIEKLVEMNPILIEKINDIFYGFYDKDIISEEVFMKWYKLSKSKWVDINTFNKIKDNAKNFIEWLKTS